ncbi:MAG: hypothetical protein R3192_18080 [Woeseiaceae bacterium]|nr:hypothetical protein [Woeseiaceae bacterium]
MRVRSKLADVDFQFGEVKRDGNLLIINSHPEATMKSRVYVSPDDVTAFLKKFFMSPSAMLFVLGFPFFWFRHRKSRKSGR